MEITYQNKSIWILVQHPTWGGFEKTTLFHLNPEMQYNKTHISLDIVSNPIMVKRANIKCRILTSTYSLQYNRCFYYKQVPTATCLLCGCGDEDKEHFILKCPDLQDTRSKYMSLLLDSIPCVYINRSAVILNSIYLLHLILDCTHHIITDIIPLSRKEQCHIETASQLLVYGLHIARHKILLNKANLA